jgi:hypothetical protein
MPAKKTTQQFVQQATLKHNNRYDYSKVDYKGAKTKVTIICCIHGGFKQRPNDHLRGNGCPKCCGKEKKTAQQFIQEATLKHDGFYDYSKAVYVKSKIKVTITCPKHGDFDQIPNSHLRGQGCPKCIPPGVGGIAKTTQQFVEEATLKHNGFYDYSKVYYVNGAIKVTIICPVHGDFDQVPDSHLRGNGCPKCDVKKRTKTTQQFIEQATLKHNGFYTYPRSDYKGAIKPITITCPKHGDFDQTPHSHLLGNGCIKCTGKEKKSTEQFIEEANKIHNNRYHYSKVDYKNIKTKVTIACPVHGDFDQIPSNHLRDHGCPKCTSSISKPSQKWLDYLGIPNIIGETREVRIKLGNKAIVADGFDPQTNTIYEFHGDFWHGNPARYDLNDINKVANKTFGELLKKTQKRSRLIKSHGYNLVSIWESDWEKINKQIDIEAAK